MGVEIERKFLVANDAWREGAERAFAYYRQGYLAYGEKAVVRVRIGGDDEAWICVKERRIGVSRGEYEYPIPANDARQLLGLAAGTVIEKRRHLVPHAEHRWEVDEFLGANAGLVLAEIELASEDEAFERPSWLGEEVSADPRYYNAALALNPWREWPENAT